MRNVVLLAMAGSLALAPVAFAQGMKKAEWSANDKTFVMKAGVSNMFEIETSEVALKKSGNAEVKKFAQEMIADHTKAGKDLMAIVGDAAPKKLDAAHEKKLDDLKAMDGAKFDEAYMRDQKMAHDDAVTLFKGYSTSGDNADLKTFAKTTLPVLEKHHMQVEKLGAHGKAH